MRGLGGVMLVISGVHTSLKADIRGVSDVRWQRCCVHWVRNALAHVPRCRHTAVTATHQAFGQGDCGQASAAWHHVADQTRRRWPKLAALVDEGEKGGLALLALPALYRTRLHRTGPVGRPNREIMRRADVVGLSRTRPRSCARPVPCSPGRTANRRPGTATGRPRASRVPMPPRSTQFPA
ncbi:transposase [Paralimibaculum aggregatum]|uniref:transposase n=1 Tax=Paralimibaculum aggregatum TaxID=3036245 RepID=UPI00331F02BA